MHVRLANSADDAAREDTLSLSPGLLLLSLPFDAADRIFAVLAEAVVSLAGVSSARWVTSKMPHCGIGSTRSSVNPHQRIEAIWRVACPNPVKVRRKGVHLTL
jgi:hypothetical protein